MRERRPVSCRTDRRLRRCRRLKVL